MRDRVRACSEWRDVSHGWHHQVWAQRFALDHGRVGAHRGALPSIIGKREYARLEKRVGSNKAVVVIARKLLVVVWHVLTDREADRHVTPQYSPPS